MNPAPMITVRACACEGRTNCLRVLDGAQGVHSGQLFAGQGAGTGTGRGDQAGIVDPLIAGDDVVCRGVQTGGSATEAHLDTQVG